MPPEKFFSKDTAYHVPANESYHFHRSFEEAAEGFAFQQTVTQQGQVGELVDEFFLLLGVGLV